MTEDKLSEIRKIQSELNETLNTIGYIESQKHALLHKIKTINDTDDEITECVADITISAFSCPVINNAAAKNNPCNEIMTIFM